VAILPILPPSRDSRCVEALSGSRALGARGPGCRWSQGGGCRDPQPRAHLHCDSVHRLTEAEDGQTGRGTLSSVVPMMYPTVDI
jgi:hypothetical protein